MRIQKEIRMSFQKTTIKIAVGLLLFFLAVIAVLLYRAHSNVVFPPEYSECPDYWTVIGKNKCRNDMTGPNSNGPEEMTADFNGDEYKGRIGLKNKCTWANSHNVVWDRITDQSCSVFDSVKQD